MRIQKTTTEYLLNAAAIDAVSGQVQTVLEAVGMEKRNIQRLRLSMEEILLCWQDAFAEDTPFTVTTGSRFGRPYLSVELAGEQVDPLGDEEDNFGTRMLETIGLSPSYSYQRGRNCVTLRPEKKRLNPLWGLAIAVIAAVLFGLCGQLMPADLRTAANETLLTPIYETFLGILTTVAGPMIFLSVAWGIYGIGDAATFGKIGRKLLLRFLLVTGLFTAVTLVACYPLFQLQHGEAVGSLSGIKSVFTLLLGIFPKNIISPFLEGNTLQIILLATVAGCIMLIFGNRTKTVARLIEQCNHIIQYLMKMIGNLVPVFVFVVLLQFMWSDAAPAILAAWKPVVMYLVLAGTELVSVALYLCIRERVSPWLLFKKVAPAMLIAFTTASSSAAFATNVSCCEKRLGIDSKMTNFGIPLSIALLKPTTTISFSVFALYFAEIYAVEVSAVWMITAVIVITLINVASPPIPNGALTCYAIVFTQLHIPVAAIGVVVVLDVMMDFIATGCDLLVQQCTLVLAADRADMLDHDILRGDLTENS